MLRGSRSVKSGNTVVIVVLVIIAIVVVVGLGLIVLGTLVVTNFSGVVGSGPEKSAKIELQALGKALDLYRIDMNSYPDQKVGLKALEECPEGSLNWSGPYLVKGVPKDPWGQEYLYRIDFDDNDGQVYRVWSAGPNLKNENGEDGTDDIVVYSDR